MMQTSHRSLTPDSRTAPAQRKYSTAHERLVSHANGLKPGVEPVRRGERAFGVDLAVGEDEERVERQRRVVFEEGPASGSRDGGFAGCEERGAVYLVADLSRQTEQREGFWGR
jgi:hypothetical protein